VAAPDVAAPETGSDVTIPDVAAPEAPSGSVTAISAGVSFVCALLSNGTVRCWGDNEVGQLGNGATANSSTPVAVTGLSGVTAISAGSGFACALLSDGTVQCWGDLIYTGVNGLYTCTGTPCSPLPVTVAGLSGVTAISAGNEFACALLSGGSVQCWGDNTDGQLGSGTTGPQTCNLNLCSTTCSTTPVAVMDLSDATAISAGGACALVSNGTVECWGYNAYGELGNGTTTSSPIPVAVSGLSGVTAIASSGSFACALVAGGAVECWGINPYGELGNGTTTGSPTPVIVGLPAQ
jgi:alpha-tubulin suppressor-like RCC1 family protein